MRRAYGDRFDIRVAQQVVERRVESDAQLGGLLGRGLRVQVMDRHKPRVRQRRHLGRVPAPNDPGGPDDPNSYLLQGLPPISYPGPASSRL